MFFFQHMPSYWRALSFLFVFSLHTSSALAAKAPSPIAAFDWAIGEALLSLGSGPVLMGNIAAFHTWTGNEYIDSNIIDIGTPIFPNMELLSRIDPQHILLAPRQTRMEAILEKIAPSSVIHSFPFAKSSTDELWIRFDAFIREIGALSGRRDVAEQLIIDTQSHLDSLKDELGPQPPLLVVQLITEQHVRVFGDNSMLQGVLEQLGLNNAWTGKTDHWGRSLVSIGELFDANLEEARLVIVQSAFPVGIENNIETSGMWRYLPSIQRRDFVVLPPSFWTAGVQPSAQRFADALVEALQ